MIGPFGPFIITSCYDNGGVPYVVLGAPGGIQFELPITAYEMLRVSLGLPDLVCP